MSFIQALQATLNKQSSQNRKKPEQIDAAIHRDWGGFEDKSAPAQRGSTDTKMGLAEGGDSES